jgi:hypothetical protein
MTLKILQRAASILFAAAFLHGQLSAQVERPLPKVDAEPLSMLAAGSPRITRTGDCVALHNESIRFEFDLSSGTCRILDERDGSPAISGARLKIDDWSSDQPAMRRSWEQRAVSGPLGDGMALDLSFSSEQSPGLLFSFILYEGLDFLSATAGIVNTGKDAVRVKDIHVLADGKIYDGLDLARDFAMIDGFSGGEPLEYGRRFYSPLTRSNALKSRNNILLTFTAGNRRRVMVMGGLTYHDFEKFATIAQTRRTELELGGDQKNSLLCYLDLPREESDQSAGGESLELIQGKGLRTWENHEFRCSEMATSAMDPERIVIEAAHLRKDMPYTLGFSWWQGLRHGDHPDLLQSVFVEYENGGKQVRLPLLENQKLPRFDGMSKEDVEQVELALPPDAIRAGRLRVVVEKSEASGQSVYLSEIWIRDGRHQSLLPAKLTPVSQCPRPRRSYTAQLFASDPVGKRVLPGGRYMSPDQFYIDVTGSDPFVALENYGQRVRQAQQVQLSMYDFPTVCLWYAADKRYGGIGKEGADNTSLGAVEEARDIVESGFLKYSRAAVRLVPDSYMPNNQQGWWDDAHWQREDTDRDTTQNGRYVEPYETTEKWGQAVTRLGVIPLTYFQTSYRSEDYAEKFPGHMLFNQRHAWKGEPVDMEGEMFTKWENTWTRNGRTVWGYDFTDPDFIAHLHQVYANLKRGGIKGLMFDYPASGWAKAGGMEDGDSTTAAAYRTIFRLPHGILGPESYVHERNMERGTDVTLGVVASMRTENDTDEMDGTTVTRCGLRWYKNRVVVNLDTDSKNLLELEKNRDHVRAVLTMCYVTSGRLLLANSFNQFSENTLRDLSRTFPYHATPKSARPVDAFVSDMPMVYDYEVSPEWHQVTFYNPDQQNPKRIGIDLSGPQVDGALGLDPEAEYHLYDFWNDGFLGRMKGTARLEQILRPGEARMISVRACLQRPQVISTDRHLMQGYLDMRDVNWDHENHALSGVSKIVGNDPYRVVLASNSYSALRADCRNPGVKADLVPRNDGLVELVLQGAENTDAEWSVRFRGD